MLIFKEQRALINYEQLINIFPSPHTLCRMSSCYKLENVNEQFGVKKKKVREQVKLGKER